MKKSSLLFILIALFSQLLVAQPGSIDLSFNPGSGSNQGLDNVKVQPDGKIMIVGTLTLYNGSTVKYMARLNANGTIDPSFASVGTGYDNSLYSMAIQPSDGKYLMSGDYSFYNGVGRRGISRLNTDGTLDLTFNPGTGINGHAYYNGIVVQPDGKILLGGLFSSYNGTSRKYIARANTDGTLDLTFAPGTGCDAQVVAVALQPDGKIIIGGDFTVYNGTPANHIIRLNADGTIDGTFNYGTGTDVSVYTINVLPSGKIIIAGGFTYYNGSPANSIARLNSDGTLDATFNSGAGVTASVTPNIWTSAVQSDGKILIGGEFTNYGGSARSKFARINADGSLDNTFNVGTGIGPAGYCLSLALQPDGKVVITGSSSFTNYNGTSRNRVARVNGNMSPTADFTTSTSTVCGSGTITCTDASLNFPTSWLWSVTPSAGTTIATPTASSTTITFASIGTYNVKLKATNVTGTDSITKVVNVYALPVATATAAGPTTFCLGGSVGLSVTSAASYLWNTGATTQNITASQSGNYSATITDVHGCTDLSNVINVVEDSAANPGICLVTVDSAVADHNIIYWDKSSGLIADIDSFRIYREVTTGVYSHIASVPRDSLSEYHDYGANPNVTSYKYKVGIRDTCGGVTYPMSLWHSTIHLQVLGGGNLQWTLYDIESSPNPVTFYRVLRADLGSGSSPFLPISSTIPGGNTTYTDLAYATYPSADYRMEVTWSLTCNPTRTLINTTRSNIKHQNLTSGITQEGLNEETTIYPNPAQNEVTIELSEIIKTATIEIYNALGQKVYGEKMNGSGTTITTKHIDLANYTKGIYTIAIESNGTKVFKKLVVN